MQLGLDVKAAEEKRRRTMATSIIECSSPGLLAGKRGSKELGRATLPR